MSTIVGALASRGPLWLGSAVAHAVARGSGAARDGEGEGADRPPEARRLGVRAGVAGDQGSGTASRRSSHDVLASSNAPRVGAPLDGTGEGIDSEGISVGRLYDEMRRLATGYLRGERAGHTLQATALVNEACVRLLESGQLSFRDREHYLATAARVMRRVLIDHARARRAEKRGGAVYLAPLTADICAGSAGSDGVSVLELDRALAALADHHPRAARLIELRVFASLTIVQAARVLEVSRKTASADLRYGRAWLSRAIESGEYAA